MTAGVTGVTAGVTGVTAGVTGVTAGVTGVTAGVTGVTAGVTGATQVAAGTDDDAEVPVAQFQLEPISPNDVCSARACEQVCVESNISPTTDPGS